MNLFDTVMINPKIVKFIFQKACLAKGEEAFVTLCFPEYVPRHTRVTVTLSLIGWRKNRKSDKKYSSSYLIQP